MEVSQAYILGIKEGRGFLTRFPDAKPAQEIETLTRLIKTHSGDMKECFKGQLDFWKGQLKK